MNITNKVYEELININLKDAKAILAFMNGILKADGSLQNGKAGLRVEIATHNYQTLLKFNEYFKKIYKDTITIEFTTTDTARKTYKGVIEGKNVNRILTDLKWCEFSKEEKIKKINSIKNLSYGEEEIAAFMQALFVAQGSLYCPVVEEKQGYHLEIPLKDKEVAQFVTKLLSKYEINLKTIERDDLFFVYLKNSSEISDFLALTGATDNVFQINDIIANRTIRNQINRQNNCYIANLDKTINASEMQYSAIEKIIANNKYEELDEKLKDLAKIRIENKELSLDAIASILGISKSGVNHRFKKIIEIADKIES